MSQVNNICPPPLSKFYVFYRISDKVKGKEKTQLANATKQHCLENAVEIFGKENFFVIADNCSSELVKFIKSLNLNCEETHLGNSGSFSYVLNKIISENKYNASDIIYLLEDDYLHLPGSRELICEGLEIADYVTLYDHSDQYLTYINERHGAAPFNRKNLHSWRIFLTKHSHWRETPSTTMTFAARVKTICEDSRIIAQYLEHSTPQDFRMFLKLTKQKSFRNAMNVFSIDRRAAIEIIANKFAFLRQKRLLISCIPGRSTHCEKKFLSPLTEWEKI